MSQWYLYMIRSNYGSLYTGITTDIERRFQEHSGGSKGARALRGKGPLELVYCQPVADRSQASRLEAAIKKLTKSKKEQLVAGTICCDDLFAS